MSATIKLETTAAAAVPAHDAAPQASATAGNVGQLPVRQPASTQRAYRDGVDGLHESAVPAATHHVAAADAPPLLTTATTLPAVVTTEKDAIAVAKPSSSTTSLKRKATGVDGPAKHADLKGPGGHGSPDMRHQPLPVHGTANGSGITSPGVVVNRNINNVGGDTGRVASGDGRGDGDAPHKKAKGTGSRHVEPAPPREPVPTSVVANGSGITSPPAIIRHPHGVVRHEVPAVVVGDGVVAAARGIDANLAAVGVNDGGSSAMGTGTAYHNAITAAGSAGYDAVRRVGGGGAAQGTNQTKSTDHHDAAHWASNLGSFTQQV